MQQHLHTGDTQWHLSEFGYYDQSLTSCVLSWCRTQTSLLRCTWVTSLAGQHACSGQADISSHNAAHGQELSHVIEKIFPGAKSMTASCGDCNRLNRTAPVVCRAERNVARTAYT